MAKNESHSSLSLAQQGNSERQDSLTVISLMHSHCNPRMSCNPQSYWHSKATQSHPSHAQPLQPKNESQPSVSLAKHGNSERQDSLIVISLMHSHGNSGPSEQQAAIRSMLYGSTHVQGLGGPSVVQHIGLCCMAEPDCIHCLCKGEHASPLQAADTSSRSFQQ